MSSNQNPLIPREERDAMRARAEAASKDWELVTHEKECGGFGCTPNGCPGHDTDVAYDVAGPFRLPDGDADGCRETYLQADRDSKFIFHARMTDLPRLLAGYEHLLELLRAADGHSWPCNWLGARGVCPCKLVERRAALKGAEDGI
jgi:hypothetical protein